MGGRSVRRVGLWRLVGWLLPVAVLALAVAASSVLWSRGDLNGLICDGDCGPDYVVAPSGLMTGTTPTAARAAAAPAGTVDPAKLAAAVGGTLDAAVLGPRVGFAAIDPTTGRSLFAAGEGALTPASTTKVLTSFAALSLIDPQSHFSTKVVQAGDRVVLVGGGDPYLATKAPKVPERAVAADLKTLARRTAAALDKAGTTSVQLGYDSSLFTGPSASPQWEPTYISGNIVTPVSALWVDRGIDAGVRAADPAVAAARTFAGLLADRGITVTGEPAEVKAPTTSPVLGVVASATVSRIIETMIRTSDNEAAEVMLRQAALAAGEPASFTGGAAAVQKALAAADVDTAGLRLTDGSGLSRANRIAPTTLAQTVRAALSTPRTSGLLADLPVSGFTGTLLNRFAGLESAQGLVRAKTGTLTGIHSLTGYAVDTDGLPVIFAVMADRADEAQGLAAQAALDRAASAIAACSCG